MGYLRRMTTSTAPSLRALAWRQTLSDFRAGELRLLAVDQNFVELFAALPQLTRQHAYTLARNSFKASFAPPEAKARWTAALDSAFAAAA